MIPDDILSEYENLAESALAKQDRWTPGTHRDRAPRWDWVTGKLLEIISIQEERIDALERKVAELGNP